METRKRVLKSAKDLLIKYDFVNRLTEKVSYSSTEHQDFGLRLASKLGDKNHLALYIKYAKELPRGILDAAVAFAIDYPIKNTDGNRGRIFMWKIKELCKEKNVELPKVVRKVSKKKQYLKMQTKLL